MNFPYAMKGCAIFAAGLVLAAFLVWIVRSIARRVGFTDGANRTTGTTRANVALGGGVAVIAVATLVTLAFAGFHPTITRLMSGIVPACLLGLLDDRFVLAPLTKLAGQIFCAALYLVQLNLSVPQLLVGAAFIVAASNAWNLVDVMDGLLGTVGLLCLTSVAVVWILHRHAAGPLPTLLLATAGALAGFLVWNRHPATIYLGDAGSLALGMLFGSTIVESMQISAQLGLALMIPGLVPFFETGFLVIERTRRRIPFYVSTPDHFALRLRNVGFSVRQIVGMAAGVTALLGWAALILEWASGHRLIELTILCLITTGMIACYWYLHRLPTPGRAS